MPQGFATIGVRRATRGIVPRRVAAVAQGVVRQTPGPQFDERVHPQVQMKDADVGPDVADLLLAGPAWPD